MSGLALSVVGDWASNKLSHTIDTTRGEKNSKIAEVLGNLTNVAIASSWDANAINTYVNGLLSTALKKEAADIIPENFKDADDFLDKALARLTKSYAAFQGDIHAVSKDMALFLAGKNL